ncbi:MAG: methyl-accepting chemotaxis protein [Pyrinomonadaceae bacterium]
MQENPIWNLLTRAASFFAVILLLLGAGLIMASYFGWTENQIAGVCTIILGVAVGIFSLITTNISNLKLQHELRTATDIAHQLAQGEMLEDDFDGGTEMFDSLIDISTYFKNKSQIISRISSGDLSDEVVLNSDSDKFGKSFQDMIGKLRPLVETQEKRDALQDSILKLSKEVSLIAAGDLTVEAETEQEMTGTIAVALNSMTGEFRSLIKQVKDVTFQVGTSANAINDTTEQLARGSEAQSVQISRMTAAISDMALRIQEVSENASLSAQVAGDSLNNSRYGAKAVQDNIGAMNSIRKQVQETAKRIKKLGERSQEISKIVQLIDDLSDRTSLLALNASLQASAAGEAGRGSAVVAEEVERLADRSTRLTQQIAALTQTMQTETKDVVASMEETIHEVVVGSTLADKAGQALVEIEQVSTRLAELIRSISESAKHQAVSAEDISTAMTSISKVTELVQTGAKRAADSVKMLVELSDELRGSVAPFKLPEDRITRKKPISETNANGVFLN